MADDAGLKIYPIPGQDRSFRVVLDQLDQGWSTRTFPHLLSPRQLYVADNVVFNRDGLISKRPGNIAYGGGSGATGSGVRSRSGARFYPVGAAPILVTQSGGNLYSGNDGTGAFTVINNGMSTTTPATYTQMYDPDMSSGAAPALFICDGSRVPQLWDGTNFVAVKTGASGGVNYLPNSPASGSPIQPKYCIDWAYSMVYAGDPTDPTGLYISDALRPERFTGYALLDSAGSSYIPYYPGGRDGSLGNITGLAINGPFLIIFFTAGIVAAINTGTYGAFQYQFQVISRSTGCPSPYSIASFGTYIIFFGGDGFYATDGQQVLPVPDLIPSVYGNTGQSAFPSEMANKTDCIGVRRGSQYWASYDVLGNGTQTVMAVFDTAANGGWTPGAGGGAWSRWPTGMTLGWGVECRGPGDNYQMFWGSSTSDLIAQNDTGPYSDFGQPIACEIRAKALFLDKPVWPKDVQALYVIAAFPFSYVAAFQDSVQAYVLMDAATTFAPTVSFPVILEGAQYDSGITYDSGVTYGAGQQIITTFVKAYPQQDAKSVLVQPGVIEVSTNPFNMLSFVLEVIVDEPAP